jgi:DNA polymerase-1
MNKNQLYLIDAMALIYRSFYALNKNPRINSKGLNTSAILGFFNTLLDIIQKHNPTHLAICFDLQAPTFRHEEYEQYKSNREAMPEDIRTSIPYIKKLIEAMNIPMISKEGYEADDVIGTLAKKAAKQNFDVFMVTPDKDYAQLVDDNIFILKLPRMGNPEQIMGVKEVLEKFEIRTPCQVIDILGLWGDCSDNIPGVKGIGEKKAKALMKDFDSIEDILANTNKIENNSVRKAIEDNKDSAIISKELATIRLDVPIEFNEKECQMEKPNFIECKRLFDELEFKKFPERFFSFYKINQQPQQENQSSTSSLFDNNSKEEDNSLFSFSSYNCLNSTPHSYSIIEEDTQTQSIIELIRNNNEFAFSLNIVGENIDSKIKGLAIVVDKNKGFYLPFNDSDEITKQQIKPYKQLFEDNSINKICYDLKKNRNCLLNYGIEISGNVFDIMLSHYLIASEERSKIDDLSQIYLNYEAKILQKTNDINVIKDFFIEQSDIIYQLYPIFKAKLKEDEEDFLFYDVEMPLVEVLSSMEREGVRIDVDVLKQFSLDLQKEKESIEKKIYDLAGIEFNISSPKQLGEILFDRLDINNGRKAKKTKTKQFSTSEEVLEKLLYVHPIIPLILEYRSITKLKSTYIDALPLLINKKTNKIHTSFNQAITATGRLSSTNPNLQNIPIRTERGKEIRRAFIPSDDNHILLSADYSQIELRIIASLSNDKHMCNDFIEGKDIHLATASKIYHLPPEEVTKDMRRNAKSVNFGIIYGISAFGLAEGLHIPRSEAQNLIDQYFLSYPDIKQFIEDRIAFSQKHGYAITLCNRRRYLPNINSANGNLRNFDNRNAVNMTIQGTSADMIKIAMVNIFKQIKEENLTSKMILQIHDELIFDVKKEELSQIKEIVTTQMQNALKLNVPVFAQCSVGNNWLEAK